MIPVPKSHIPVWIAAIVFSVASTAAYGLLDGRWISPSQVELAARELTKVPKSLGDWTLLEERELDDNTQQILRCFGHTHRVYRNSRTGAEVTIAVLFGPRGPIAVHTPEICYSGQGIKAVGERIRVRVSGREDHFWQLSFLSNVDFQPALEVHYAWSDGGRWQAAEQPRFWLTDRLYKIQVAGPPTPAGQESESLAFLELYLENLAPHLADFN